MGNRLFLVLALLLLPLDALAAKPVCGDGDKHNSESCDGTDFGGDTCATYGYDAGALACTPGCQVDTSSCTFDAEVCGDGFAEGTESCDGTDLAGQTCQGLGFDGGTLSCDGSCGYDTSGCTSADPFCGDGLVNGAWEECDGASDGLCPGLCSDACACPATTGTGLLEIHAVDVGQGDGLVVVSPDGFVMLLDAGTESHASVMASYLQSIGIGSVDYTLVSHFHEDHLGGMDLLLDSFPEIVAAFDHGGTATTGESLEYDAAAGTRRTPLATGQTIDLGPSMTAEVLHAFAGSSNENDNSLVVKLTYGTVTALLGGDCESPCENDFDPGPTRIYKVHHHGSSSSTTTGLLDQMLPDTALISCGVDNPYGHPHPQTLDRLTSYGVDVWRTDLDGDIEVLATPSSYTVNGFGTCTDGAVRTCGVTDTGACSLGTETCAGGTWQPCEGAVDPTAETCDNGLDDDCDGTTDAADAECAVGGHVRIAQVYYDTAGTDSAEEYVELYNPTAAPVAVAGWSLLDNVGTFTLPSGATVPANDYLTVARDAAGFQAHFGSSPEVGGMTLSLGNSGDLVILRDGSQSEVDRVSWESYEQGWSIAAGTGAAIERVPPSVDSDTVSDWTVTDPAAPH